ncbi:hypothetical protein [Vulcanisaeta distributa]|uniref:hypothetical protein n=1 Tax=Vulcanisaeta distributa TaxID=164451 RepID=UPI001FB1A85A|nr:hypothetical protein [Vulcanisaeta distributa]
MKVKGSRRLKCGELVDDPRVIEETMRLINEFMRRLEKHRNVLLSDETTPFDETIKALSEWLPKIEEEVNENNDKTITNLRKTTLKAGRKILRYLDRARKKWLKTYRQELEELINKLRSGETKIIISGEPFNEDKSFAVHLYAKHIAINASRMASSGGVAVLLRLTGLRGGFRVITPKLFGENKLRAMRCGLLMTDGAIDKKGYPEMDTNQAWQVFAWLITWPGRNSMYLHGVGLNDHVSITWNLMAIDHKGVFEDKAEVSKQAGGLGYDDFMAFLLFAILGDGDISARWKSIRLVMGKSKREVWGGEVIKRLEGLGFKERKRKHKITYVIKSSKAAELAKKMLDNPSTKALIEDLGLLPDAEKLKRLITLVGMKSEPKGKSSVEVAGIRMTVSVNGVSRVELRVTRRDYEEARAILERLKGAGYEEVDLVRRGKRYVVYMGMDAIRKHPELVTKVCEVLRRMLEEAVSEGKERRAKAITKAMAKLNCPPPKAHGHDKTTHLESRLIGVVIPMVSADRLRKGVQQVNNE